VTEPCSGNRFKAPADCDIGLVCFAMYGFIIFEVCIVFGASAEGNEVALAGHQSAGLQLAEGIFNPYLA
jgi:hypothetical protein